MKQITSILIGAGLRGGYVYSQYALDHPDEFKVIAVAEPDQERRNFLRQSIIFQRNYNMNPMKNYYNRTKWQIVL